MEYHIFTYVTGEVCRCFGGRDRHSDCPLLYITTSLTTSRFYFLLKINYLKSIY